MILERKARWVKDGHRTPTPTNSTYAGDVSCESVWIALSYAALNSLDVCGLIFRMLIYKHLLLRNTTSSVDPSLDWRMLANMPSFVFPCMVVNLPVPTLSCS